MVEQLPISDERIAESVLQVLREQPDPLQPQYLAAVGNRVSSLVGIPLKQILGGRKFRAVLHYQLGDKLIFEGEPSGLQVRLSSLAASDTQPIRFNSSFWAGFSKPIAPESRRWMRSTPPFQFEDRPKAAMGASDEVEITLDYIPSTTLPRSERDVAIVNQIKRWCGENNKSPELFRETRDVGWSPHPEKRATDKAGLSSVIRLIEAIPETERGNFSLPLNLLHRLLKGG
jgi:hypothetical protein